MSFLGTSRRVRSQMYRGARLLGDVNAVATGKPGKVAHRVARRVVGRQVGLTMRRILK